MTRPTSSTRLTLAVSIAVLAVSACGNDSDPAAATPVSVTRSQRTFIDMTRSTPMTNGFAGSGSRTLRTVLWAPSLRGPLPLLIMAHGFGGEPEEFDAFARTVAAAGFIVAAPAFPLTSDDAPGGHQFGLVDVIHQPGDLTFVISELVNADASPGDALHGQLDATRIAVLGQSLGGVTVIALTRKNCCRDDRVRASILVDALTTFGGSFGSDPITAGPPTLIMHGTADATVAISSSVTLYNSIAPPRFFLGILGAGHSDAVESQADPPIHARDSAERATIAFLNAQFRGDGAGLAQTLSALQAEGDTAMSDPTP